MALTFLGRGKTGRPIEGETNTFDPPLLRTPIPKTDIGEPEGSVLELTEVVDAPLEAPPRAEDKSRDLAPPETRSTDDLLDKVRETIARMQEEDRQPHTTVLLDRLERLGSSYDRQAEELQGVRAETARLTGETARLADENARLAEENAQLLAENEQMRGLLDSLLAAMEKDRQRVAQALAEAERRLREVTPA